MKALFSFKCSCTPRGICKRKFFKMVINILLFHQVFSKLKLLLNLLLFYLIDVFEDQENVYSKAEYMNKNFLFNFPDTLRFTQGRWKFEKLGLDPKEGKIKLNLKCDLCSGLNNIIL